MSLPTTTQEKIDYLKEALAKLEEAEELVNQTGPSNLQQDFNLIVNARGTQRSTGIYQMVQSELQYLEERKDLE